ncbi:cell division topological specificity factor MinE [Thiomicrospira cyclica]|jgi:cell division topological specificity factor|uniref:Cell division topological specificity factor n=1 Tax=Thiomicrospira cyclica (strain DSM 14477 / JCM 11371 / ALM1) TaxID=717773 RepID=F6D8J8_THICA|nr:cell division topological specificity factor MinE [Thiomicrospira cyclica]AEG31849.1 Cell division topological specificity factor [Thiomicrospira cyclica ALM1]
MRLLDYLLGQNRKGSANQAKDRLQILLAHERSQSTAPDYLPKMRQEILEVIGRYVDIDEENLQISLDADNGYEVLELNLILPDAKRPS